MAKKVVKKVVKKESNKILDIPNKYLLKNISTSDINLSDLRYRIPAGKTRDLLGKTAHLKFEDIVKSRYNGSIKARLGKSLAEVTSIVEAKPPPMTEFKPKDAIIFPQRIKSYITIEVGDVTDEIKNLIMNDDEEFFQQLQDDANLGDEKVPLISKKEE